MFFSYGVKICTDFLPFSHNSRVWQTNRRTDRQTEFSSLDRVCIPCSAVKNEHMFSLASGSHQKTSSHRLDSRQSGRYNSPIARRILPFQSLTTSTTPLSRTDQSVQLAASPVIQSFTLLAVLGCRVVECHPDGCTRGTSAFKTWCSRVIEREVSPCESNSWVCAAELTAAR